MNSTTPKLAFSRYEVRRLTIAGSTTFSVFDTFNQDFCYGLKFSTEEQAQKVALNHNQAYEATL
jgi:hypothetical protein